MPAGGTNSEEMMKGETTRFWAEAAQQILGHHVTFSGPKGRATCQCAGASTAPGLRWCEAERQSRQIRLCTGVGGECRIVRPSSLTRTDRRKIVPVPDDDSEAAKAGVRKRPAIYLVQKDGERFEIYSSIAKAVSVLPEGMRELAVESVKATESGPNSGMCPSRSDESSETGPATCRRGRQRTGSTKADYG